MSVNGLTVHLRPLLLLAAFLAVLGRPGAQAKEPLTDKDIAALLEPIRTKYKLPALAAAVVSSKGLTAVAAVGVRKAHFPHPCVRGKAGCLYLGASAKRQRC